MTTINCDMGESFGLYKMGDDAGLMPLIDIANVACGFHASDFNHMRATVPACQGAWRARRRASFAAGSAGLRPARDEDRPRGTRQLPDLPDRRAEGLSRGRGHDAQPYQAARRRSMAWPRATRRSPTPSATRRDVFKTPLLGMNGTLHEKVYRARGHRFIAEFYADLDYNDDGRPHHHPRARRQGPRRGGGQMRARHQGGQGAHHRRARRARRRRHDLRPFRHAERARHRGGRARPSVHRVPPVARLSRGPRWRQDDLSPLPGTFYRRPAPDKPPFKSEGDTVAVGEVIGLIEVMKSFIEVHADAAGKIVAFRRRQRRARSWRASRSSRST